MKLREEVKNTMLGMLLGILIIGSFFIYEARAKQVCDNGNSYYCTATWEK